MKRSEGSPKDGRKQKELVESDYQLGFRTMVGLNLSPKQQITTTATAW